MYEFLNNTNIPQERIEYWEKRITIPEIINKCSTRFAYDDVFLSFGIIEKMDKRIVAAILASWQTTKLFMISATKGGLPIFVVSNQAVTEAYSSNELV